MTFKAVFLCAVIAGVSTLAISCAAPAQTSQTENTKPIETVAILAADFTTIGKATRTIKTPWESKEIYDPAQDPQVQAAFDNLWSSPPEDKVYSNHPILEIAQRTAAYDMARSGCLRVKHHPSLMLRGGTEMYFQSLCPRPNWHSPKLNICETREATWDDIPAYGYDNRAAFSIRKVGQRKYGNKAEQLEKLFYRECNQWHKIESYGN